MAEDSKEFNNWHCLACDKTMPYDEVVAHLQNVHGIFETKGTQEMISHADGRDFYDWRFKWTIAGLIFMQHSRTMRYRANWWR